MTKTNGQHLARSSATADCALRARLGSLLSHRRGSSASHFRSPRQPHVLARKGPDHGKWGAECERIACGLWIALSDTTHTVHTQSPTPHVLQSHPGNYSTQLSLRDNPAPC